MTFICMGIGMATAQTSTITGKVYSESDGEPVLGASVFVVGTTVGASTDMDGNFTIENVPATATTIRVTYVGMTTQEVKILRDKPMKIVLVEDGLALDEVIVTAYGTQKKGSFTGSSATIKAEKLENLQVSNISKALEGMAPGVQVALQSGQPGSDASISVRGIGSINASSSPLIVVDGMPYDGSLSNINTADIERMDVLKDASSTALYGSRAANGVIMITTKKGNAQKSKVTFDASYGINQRGISNYDVMTDPYEYISTLFTALKNNKIAQGMTPEAAAAEVAAGMYGTLGYNPFVCANNEIIDANGNITTAALRYNDSWEDEALRQGQRQEYNMTVQGGNDRSTHYVSLGYLQDQGIVSNSDFQRLSFRSNGDFAINDFIKINGSIAYTRGEQNSMNISSLSGYANTFAFIQQMAPIYPVYGYDANGNQIVENGKPVYDFGNGVYGTRPYAPNQNVAASDEANENQTLRDNLVTRFGATFKFLKDFQFQVNGGYDVTNVANNRFTTPTFGDANGIGYVNKQRNRIQNYTINELLTYKKSIKKHNIDVLLGHENYAYEYSYLYGYKKNVYVSDIPEFDNAITMEQLSSYKDHYALESYFGRLNYDYDEKYHFSASIRRDGSSRFHKDNRWGTFWSVGASWVASKEKFMKNAKWIDNLVVRSSYGSVGNDNILNYYPYKSQYSVSNNDGAFAVTQTYWGNKDLTWETSYNFNVGLSANLFGNILALDVEYFHKNTVDMLYYMPKPMSSGISSLPENALSMINQGVEYTVGVNIPMPAGIKWNWTLTGTHYKNEITDIPETKRESGITHNSYYNYREGHSVYDFYYYKYAGVDEATGKSMWYVDVEETVKDAEGNPVLDENGAAVTKLVEMGGTTTDYSNAQKYYIGTAIPDLVGGISTSLSWKGIDLSVQTNFQIGGDIYDAMYQSSMHAGKEAGRNWHKDIANAWTPENTKTDVPVLDGDQNANTFSDRFLIGADYFNIKNITLGYTFPKKWMKKAQIDNARIYFSAENVALFSKRKGLDPRQYMLGQSQANYSTIRTMSMGVSLTF